MLTRNNTVEPSTTGKYAGAPRQSLNTQTKHFLKHKIS